MNETEGRVRVDYFSDLLCIWAYVAERKLEECRSHFGDRIDLRIHFISIFGDVATKLEKGWAERGGRAGYARHVQSVAAGFPEIETHPEAWLGVAPASSTPAHLLVKAAQLLEAEGALPRRPAAARHAGRSAAEELAWRLRRAFFVERRDVARRDVLLEIAKGQELPVDALCERIDRGEAFAALHADAELQRSHLVEGSPTFVLDGGRQKLYGNVGYRVIQANIEELLRSPGDQASWC